MKTLRIIAFAFVLSLLQACHSNSSSPKNAAPTSVKKDTAVTTQKQRANNETILNKKQVPILCYHHITNSAAPALYTVSIDAFKAQLKMLADSGYHSILPDQLFNYLVFGDSLPSKPVMLSFDDTRVEHFTVAAAEMKKFNFKGVFFIMTIAIGKPNYMSSEQIKTLYDEGHVIASHTWDHQNLKKLPSTEWNNQLDKPRQKLESITGHPIEYFAYPFGILGDTAITELKKRNTKAAFQLSGKRKENEPLYTIRRMIVPGGMTPTNLAKYMKSLF